MTAADLDPQMIDVLRVQEERSLSRVLISQTSVTEIRNLYIQERAYWNADPPAVASVQEYWIEGTSRRHCSSLLSAEKGTGTAGFDLPPWWRFYHGQPRYPRPNHACSGHAIKSRRSGRRLSPCAGAQVSDRPE